MCGTVEEPEERRRLHSSHPAGDTLIFGEEHCALKSQFLEAALNISSLENRQEFPDFPGVVMGGKCGERRLNNSSNK